MKCPAYKLVSSSMYAPLQEGKKLDLPVYFGDAGSPAVLHAVGADQAACAVSTQDYRMGMLQLGVIS